MISEGGSRNAYVATLLRLAPYVEQAEWVVPGHGAAIDSARALAILREDIKYLESLGGAGEPALPLARRDRVQKKIHAENVARVGAFVVTAIHHVALPTRREDVEAEVAFWVLLGFSVVEPPPSLRERATWSKRLAARRSICSTPTRR